jgi:kinesin family protein 11
LLIRPRNQREIRENSNVCVTTQSNQVQIKVPNCETTKTYSFDKVFGPNASQAKIFDEVVRGMLREVLLGYNCTIFAYGQTGTGKTYTMEGDLSEPSSGSGIIPRALYSLFEQLQDTMEYSVRVSYMELYNEELKDLLSPDNDARKLKMYEDLNRKGSVVIQGLEEILVNNANDVIQVLQRGSMKRQIAATKMNDVSSRSHGIFTITVHIKEATSDGEELLKVGKLHLVDLAGSENIGRSGAENKRAKEAGMINQSLLTLGRVINALVERSPHVPYRESKLTRLLQDSLGGRTKTCIIAAVSPAKCSLEESMSTLDYAHRAKNIRNKPEVNQKMTKRALIKEYVHQIEQLKSDLLASREKNGIYLSPESYNQLVNENEGRKTHIDEIKKMMEAKHDEFKLLEDKFKQQMAMLSDTSSKLDDALKELDDKKDELERLMVQTQELQQRLLEQEYIAIAHATTEQNLHQLATGLKQTLKSSALELENLHDKLERKSAIERHNLELFENFQSRLFSHFSTLTSHMSSFQDSSADICSLIAKSSQAYLDQLETAAIQRETSSEQFQSQITSSVQDIEKRFGGMNSIISDASKLFGEQVNHFMSNLKAQNDALVQTQQGLVHNMKRSLALATEKMTKNMALSLDSLAKIQQEQLTTYSQIMMNEQNAYESRIASLQSQVERLRQENHTLQSLHEQNRKVVMEEQEQFMLEMQHRMNHFVSKIHTNMSSTMDTASSMLNSQIVAIEKDSDKERLHLSNFKSHLDTVQGQFKAECVAFEEMQHKAHTDVTQDLEKTGSGLDVFASSLIENATHHETDLASLTSAVLAEHSRMEFVLKNASCETLTQVLSLSRKNQEFNEKSLHGQRELQSHTKNTIHATVQKVSNDNVDNCTRRSF